MHDSMAAGDLIVFSGVDKVSKLVSISTNSEYTHVGLVLSHKGKKYLLESTTWSGDAPEDVDALSMKAQGGVMLRDLGTRLERAKGTGERLWWGKRTTPLTGEQEGALTKYALTLHGVAYDYNQALLSAFDTLDAIVGGNTNDPSKMFCSELVVSCELHVVGPIFHPNHRVPINPSEIVPREILELHCSGVLIWQPLVPV
jgi:hypothetical protein